MCQLVIGREFFPLYTYKSTKPIPVWTNWYPKNNPNPSKFQNLNIGEITNQTIKGKSEQTAAFRCVGSGSERHDSSYSGGEDLRWSEEMRRWCWCWCCFLQVRTSGHVLFGDFGFIWATILCGRVYWGLIEYLMWQLLIGGVNSLFSANSGENVFSINNINAQLNEGDVTA